MELLFSVLQCRESGHHCTHTSPVLQPECQDKLKASEGKCMVVAASGHPSSSLATCHECGLLTGAFLHESCPWWGDGLGERWVSRSAQVPTNPSSPQGFFLQARASLSWDPSAFLLRPPEMRGRQPKLLSVIQGAQAQSGPSSKDRGEWH